jgi:hypothetical protein
MGAMKDLGIFLAGFDSEFEYDSQGYLEHTGTHEDVTVRVAKVGGGTLGKKYEGFWLYTVEADDEFKAWGEDFHTGTAHSHKYVAKMIALIYSEGDLGPKHVEYPHNDGTLHDCIACEAQCFCAKLAEGQLPDVGEPVECVHCASQDW